MTLHSPVSPLPCLSQSPVCSASHITLRSSLTCLTSTPTKQSGPHIRISILIPTWPLLALILLVLTVFCRCCHYTLFTGEEFEAYLDIWTHISAKTRHCLPSTPTSGIASSSKSSGRTQRQAHAKCNLGTQTH